MNRKIAEMIEQHMEVFVNQIGERAGGSPGCRQAEDYLDNYLSDCGWQVERQQFECVAWEDLGTELRLNGRLLPASANAYSPPCDIRAAAIPAGTLAELESADLNGRVGVLYGSILPAPLSPKSWFLKSEREEQIIQTLESKQPAALVTVQQVGGGRERLIEDWEFTIPSVTVPAEVGREILMASSPSVVIKIDAIRQPGRTANIVASSRPGRQRVVLCAHHDTKYDTPGACDNASGVAILLALASTLPRENYPFAIEIVSFTNEEYLPIGDDEYMRRNGSDDLSDVIACINVDGVGHWLSPDSIALFSASDEFEAALKRLVAKYPDVVWADPWPESNHSTFAWRGVPSVAFTSASRTALAHHPQDNLYWSSIGRIARLVPLITNILDMVADNALAMVRSG